MKRRVLDIRKGLPMALAASFLFVGGEAQAGPPAGFSITCNNNCNNSGWVKDVRGTQEYELRDNNNNLICRTKIYFRVGRHEPSPGVFKNRVITRYWSYTDNAWNYDKQLSAVDVDSNDEEKWDTTGQNPGQVANFRMRSECDVTGYSRVVTGLRDLWGDIPPSSCDYEDCWEPPELASWKDYALDTLRAVKSGDIGKPFKSAAGDYVCHPGAGDDEDPDNDDERCVISEESDE